MVFILISPNQIIPPPSIWTTTQLSALDWQRIKTDELTALSVQLSSGDVFKYSTTLRKWVKQ